MIHYILCFICLLCFIFASDNKIHQQLNMYKRYINEPYLHFVLSRRPNTFNKS